MAAGGIGSVVAAISGGPDSVALLAALKACKSLKILAAHCNFHLRGEESNRDCRAVEKICRDLDVEIVVKDFDVEGYMSAHKGVSAEMACRDLRYEWFRILKEETGTQRIATGHNSNDNIETFLLNVLRGAGTSGLKAMLPDNGEIVRPLLSFSRKDILEYLSEKGLTYVTDSTNLESDYRRNFLRNEVIPLIKTRWNGFDTAVTATIRNVRSENMIVAKAISDALPPEGKPLAAEDVMGFPAPELLVRRFIDAVSPFTTTAAEIVSAIKADKPAVRRWQLRKGIVRLQGRKLYVERFGNESFRE